MPRVALFLPRFSHYGGVEGFGQRLALALANQGHDVDFICARQESPAPPSVTVRVVGRPGLTRAGKMLWFARRCERLRPEYDLTIGLGKTWRQDIVRVGGAPLRSFWRLSDRAWPKGLPRAWKRLRRRLSPANRLTLAMERVQFAQAKRIIAVSDMVRELILEEHPQVPRHKIGVIYNEPDTTRFSPAPPSDAPPLRLILGLGEKETAPDATQAPVLVGFAGSNFRLKGLAPLVRALALLPEHFHLAVAGGRDPYKYAALARRLGLAGRVHFLGKVENMPAFYHALDVFALPSFYDACANAVLEAVACGIPTVSSAANGSSVVLPRPLVREDSAAPEPLARALLEASRTRIPTGLYWPVGTQRGLEPYIRMVEEMLPTS